MARVVLATLRGAGGFEKKLVVKQIRDELAYDQQFIRRFVEEAKTTVALSHPNIVPVYELGVEQGTYFLAMELVEGVSVAELLRERNADGSRRVLSPEEGAYVGVEVCRALDYAHRRMKVVHRDITPRNVMIDEEGQVKLIDFGIAAPALVSGQEILGSPGHMAPEQVDGGELGPPTDIFAVAVLLMEVWTGAAPFRRATPEECAAAVREPHPRPSDFDPRLLPLDEPILRAMSVDPRQRQQEASELGRALRSFLQGLDTADIARALGDRVRVLREALSAQSPPSSARDEPRPAAPSHGDLGTKTFAAREEALSWSSFPPPSRPSLTGCERDDGPVPSTRQLPPSNPNIPAVPAIRANRGRPDDPAMSIPTPLMVEVDELEKIHADIEKARAERRSERPREPEATAAASTPASSTASEAPAAGPRQADIQTVRRPKHERPSSTPATNLETIATRPLETPVRSHDPLRKGDGAGLQRRGTAFVALAAAAALGAFVAWRVGGGAPSDAPRAPTTAATTTTTTAPSSTPPEGTTAAAPSDSAPAPKSAPADSRDASSAFTTAAPASSGSAVVVAGKAQVSLLGDPGTRVWVDGIARGACPTRVTLEQGSHEVRFTFEPTGESLVERFTAKAGDHLTVRAQFTGATPTVKVMR
jgi:serine/threonine-protein kinase